MNTRSQRANLDRQHQQISWYLASQGIYHLYHFTRAFRLKIRLNIPGVARHET